MLYNSIFQQLFKSIPRYRFDKMVENSTIAGIYKQRWQIELFFKWIKQNLKIKSFLSWTRKTLLKPPDWNLPDQPELFGDFIC